MAQQNLFDDINARIREVLASSPARDIEKNMRAMLAAAFSKLDLVTREEFDVQSEVLARTREKLEVLEARVAALEKEKHGAKADPLPPDLAD
jgi:BMFP domain-containing protein YqiC